MVATSSDKVPQVLIHLQGTVIRVFSIPDGAQLFQFRRGTYSAHILSLSFNLSSTMLCVSSDTDTIHVYKMEKEQRERSPSIPTPQPRRSAGYLEQL